jgi:hypothetical protein
MGPIAHTKGLDRAGRGSFILPPPENSRWSLAREAHLFWGAGGDLCRWLGHGGYSITSSARCCSIQGTSRLSALAVLRLTINSNLVGA